MKPLFLCLTLTLGLGFNAFAQDDEPTMPPMPMPDMAALQNSMGAAAAGGNEQMTPEQMAEMQKQLEILKQKQEETKKAMEELDKI